MFAGIGLRHWAQLGRQAAWRPRCILNGVVWLVASCWLMLISVCWDWALALGSTRSSSCLAPRCILNGVVWLVASCWQMLISVCWDWALALGSTRSSSCLAAEVQKPSSCLAEEIQLLVERLGSLLSLCHQAAWWH